MGDAIISRRGGSVLQQTIAPSILDFSSITNTIIRFKLTNNDAVAATLVYRFGTLTGDGESISVAANTTTAEITFIVSEFTSPTKLFVTANVTGKIKSEVIEQEFQPAPVYTAATGGTTLEYNLDDKRYKSHTFTSNGTFTVTTVGDAAGDRNKVDYLIIAGGGGGGAADAPGGGGGGAGGFRTTIAPVPSDQTPDTKPTITATSYSVTIGGGGSGTTNGSNSSVAFGTTITCTGGGSSGGGGGGNANGKNGGSGGGAAWRGSAMSGGTGILGQGRDGAGHSGGNASAGGGGAGEPGSTIISSTTGGKGGDGLTNNLRNGTNEMRAGGGGGRGSNADGANGDGGGSVANTGSGALGSISGTIGVGGSGVVIIRYEVAPI